MKRNSDKGNLKAFKEFQKGALDGLGGYKQQDAPLNPQFDFSEIRRNASFIFERLALTQNSMYYEFKGFPDYDTSWKKCRMLYYRGSLVSFVHNGYLYTLPFTFDGELNSQGFPTRIRPIAYASGHTLTDDVKNLRLTPHVDCAILLDHVPFSPNYHIVPRSVDNSILNNMKAEALCRVQMSMIAHFKKHIINAVDERTAEKLQQQFTRALQNDSPVAVVSDLLDMNKTVFESDEYVGDKYFRTMKDIQALQDIINGISTSGYGVDKNERLLAGELMGITEQIDITSNVRKRLAELYCDDCNRIFGLSTSVELQHYDRVEAVELNAMGNNQSPKTQNAGDEPSVDKTGGSNGN